MTMTAHAADEAKEAIRNATDIVQVIGERVRLRRVGTRWSGLCPFHQEKTPSFTVNPERQIWHCFGCSKGGDVFAFLMEADKVSFPEALAILGERAGIEVPKSGRGPGAAVRDRLYQANALAADFFAASLRTESAASAKARAYLAGRGFEGEILERFRIGWAPDAWDALTTTLGKLLPVKSLEETGLALRRGDGSHFDRFRNRIMFPVDAGPGKIAGFGARAIAPEDQPKYLNSSESAVFRKSTLLFGLTQARSAIRERKEILVSEGYLDVLRLHAAGFDHAVATCGTALTLDHARALSRFEAEVVLVYDGDAAGVRAADRGLDPLLAAGLAVRVLLLPAGEDPDSFLAKNPPGAFGKLLGEARDVPGFLAEASLGGEGANPSLEARVKRFIGLLSRLEDPIRRRLLVRRGSEAFGLEEGVLLEALERRKSGRAPARPVPASRREPPPAEAAKDRAPDGQAERVAPPVTVASLDPAERELAARVLTEEGAMRAVVEAGGADCFPTEALRAVIRPWVESGQPPLPEERDRLLADEPLVRGVLAMHPVEEAVPLEEQLRTARGLIERLEERRLRAALAALDRAIREAETSRDGSLERLVAERRDLASKYHQRSTNTVS